MLAILGSIFVSGVIIFIALQAVAYFFDSINHWGFWPNIIGLILGLFVGCVLFGFFVMPGGEWAWKVKKEPKGLD